MLYRIIWYKALYTAWLFIWHRMIKKEFKWFSIWFDTELCWTQNFSPQPTGYASPVDAWIWLEDTLENIPCWRPSGYVKIAIENGDLVRGFTQLENGGSFHSYVTVYQLNIMFQRISHLIQWKKNQFPTKCPLVGCTPSAYPKSQRWLVSWVYTLTCLAKPMCWFNNCVKRKTNNYYWLVVDLPLRKIWVRQLGWWHSQYDGKNNPNVPNHQPDISLTIINHY